MRVLLANGLCVVKQRLLFRAFSCTPSVAGKQWRLSMGLSGNRNAEGVLTDTPDYSYLDGRPTPLLHKQKLRILKQQDYASKIVELSAELDFAKERHQRILKEKQDQRNRIMSDRLMPKGSMLNKRK